MVQYLVISNFVLNLTKTLLREDVLTLGDYFMNIFEIFMKVLKHLITSKRTRVSVFYW